MKFKFNFRKIAILFFVFATQLILAQERLVTGIVTDDTGMPLPGVSVLVKGTKTGTQTDFDGAYAINASPSQILSFSYIGMKTQELPATTNKVSIKMSGGSTSLNEVVVTALGVKREKKSLGYATQEVKGEDLTKVNSGNVANSLSGKVAGVDIRRNNNIGGSTNVVIRGSSSLTGDNQALWVVDGVPLNNDNTNTKEQKTAGNTGGYDYGNAASDINPDDIESINVLKGAAASALYGSRAANGVILVTLKKGNKTKAGLGITFNSGVNIGAADKKTLPEYQMEYGGGYGDFRGTVDLGGGVYPYAATDDASWGPKYDPNILVYKWNSFYPELPTYGIPTPWAPVKKTPNDFYQHSLTYTNSIAVSGSNENGDFRFGYTNYNQAQGILPNSSNKKDNFNLSASYSLSPKTKISASANYLKAYAKGMNETGYGDGGNNYLSSVRQWYNTSIDFQDLEDAYNITGRNTSWSIGGPKDLDVQFHDNPYFQRDKNYNSLNRDRFFGNFAISTDVAKWLNIVGKGSVDYYTQLQEERIAVGSRRVANKEGQYSRYDKTFREVNLDLILNFKTDITENIKFYGLLGGNSRRSVKGNTLSTTNGGLIVPDKYMLSNTKSPINFPQEFLETIGTQSVYANATFNFNETYFLEGSYRVDQSSTLPKKNNTYTYPSITGTYVFSNHIDASWLSFGKLRLNYAETGNDAEFAVIQSTYDKLSNFGPDGIRFSDENNKSNADLKSELTKGYEAGIELKFFKNRVGLDFSYYKTNTTNQILSIENPSQTGYSRSWINGGDVENKGYELSLNVIPFKTKDFSWEARINWATNKNKVLDLGGAERLSIGSTQGIGYIAEVGKPIGQLIGRGYKYLDGQKVVKDNGQYEIVNGATIGDVNPEWTGGINNILNYKNFTFNFLIDIKKGGDVYSLDQQYGHTTGIYQSTVGNNHLGNPVRNSIADGGGIILDGVKANGTPNTTVVLADYDTYNAMPQERYVYDASYVKLREVGLSYRLPSKYLTNTFMNSVIFAVNGSNLWIISKNLPYADPEAGTSSGNLQGFQSGVLPTTKEYNFNLKVQF